jgi:hypothetical protein
MVVSRATFGHLGNILLHTVALVSRLFWGAVLLWMTRRQPHASWFARAHRPL